MPRPRVVHEIYENKDNIWCLKCGMTSFRCDGFNPYGKQRIRCKYCYTRTIVGALRRGERLFKEEKLLPILRKTPEEFTPAELYCMGWLISDGSLANGGIQLRFELGVKDIEAVEIVKRELHIPGKISILNRKEKGVFAFAGWQYKYSKDFWGNLGLFTNKTGAEVWLSYMRSSHFIRGYLDGDGCFYTNDDLHGRGHLEFACANELYLLNLASFIQDELGIPAPKLSLKNKGGDDWYVLYYSKYDTQMIGDYVYRDSEGIRLTRKYNKYLELKRTCK